MLSQLHNRLPSLQSWQHFRLIIIITFAMHLLWQQGRPQWHCAARQWLAKGGTAGLSRRVTGVRLVLQPREQRHHVRRRRCCC